MIVLFTDFGLAGPYTGQVNAVLSETAPGVPVIQVLLVILRAEVAAREQEDHRVVPLQLAELAPLLGVVRQLVVGEGRARRDVGPHRWADTSAGRPGCRTLGGRAA